MIASGYVFAATVFAALAFYADTYTTIIGLDKGLVEQNPINKWLFAKMGVTLTSFIEGALVIFIALGLAAWNTNIAFGYGVVFGLAEWYQAYKNYKVIKNIK